MVVFLDTKEKLVPEQIEEVERSIDLEFPAQYKNHLLRFNGGRCEPNVFSFEENGVRTASAVGWFFAIYDGEFNRLQDYIQIYKLDQKRMPHHMVAIASDVVGNALCLSCGKEDFGKIYFWDHENEVDYTSSPDSDYSNLHFVANSFAEFIESLREDYQR